jgi:hypothetical protein
MQAAPGLYFASAEKIIASAFKRQFIHILLSIGLIQDVRFPKNTSTIRYTHHT